MKPKLRVGQRVAVFIDGKRYLRRVKARIAGEVFVKVTPMLPPGLPWTLNRNIVFAHTLRPLTAKERGPAKRSKR
jgi:hypothetical protein